MITHFKNFLLDIDNYEDSHEQIYMFRVDDVNHADMADPQIQERIASFVEKKLESDFKPYKGFTNTDIYKACEELHDRVFEAEGISGCSGIEFVFEKNNPYDPDTIKVYHEEIGQIGYVPRKDSARVKNIIKTKKYSLRWQIWGGKYKYVDHFSDSICTDHTRKYVFRIDLIYE